MPTYEYTCSECGHNFETFQSIKEDKLLKCPECGKDALKRHIGTGGGLIFKGSGFYLTDYVKKGEGSPSKTDKKEAGSAVEKPPAKPADSGTSAKSD